MMRTLGKFLFAFCCLSAVAESTSDMDAEIISNLDFYQSMDVMETYQMYEEMETAPESAEVKPTESRPGGDPK